MLNFIYDIRASLEFYFKFLKNFSHYKIQKNKKARQMVIQCSYKVPERQSFFMFITQVKILFLQWLPCVLRMSRPGKKITKKTILMSNRMKELELQERSSKSLLANVLDIDDDFRHGNSAANPASGYIRYHSVRRSISSARRDWRKSCDAERSLTLLFSARRTFVR